MEIPEMSKKEKLNVIVGMTLGGTYSPIWFLEEKHGREAVEEYLEWSARQQGEMMKGLGIDNPLKFLLSSARTENNIFHSDVDVEGDENKAVLEMKKCTRLEHALQWARIGRGSEADITREGYCDICINVDFKPTAETLGFKFNVEFTDKGCKITMRR